ILMETKAKILVIDDEEGIRDLLTYELTQRGYIVSVAEDSRSGIEKIKKEKFELVILDIKMPGLSGIETIEQIKELNPEIEMIMLTGYATIETAIECMKKGAYNYITKPFNVDELSILVQRALEKKEMEAILAVYELNQLVFSSLKLDELLERIINLVIKVLKADEVSIMLFDNESKLHISAAYGLDNEIKKKTCLSIGERIAGKVIQERKPMLLIGGLKNYPELTDIQGRKEIKSSIVSPLIAKDKPLGVLNINRTKNEEIFSHIDMRNAIIFAGQLAQAIDNAYLYRELEQKIKELQDTQKQLIQSEKMAALGQLAGGAAHELNNPLTTVLGTAQILMTEISKDNPLQKDLKEIEESAQRCKEIINNMLNFARQHEFSLEPADINSVIDTTLDLCQHQIELQKVKIKKKYGKNLPFVNISPFHIQQIFFNIILNAQQAMPDGGNLTITTKLVKGKVEISFTDTGVGIKKENLVKIFEPFFTTRKIGKGTGLGLSVSYGIVQKHKGTIKAKSEGEGKGATFIVTLPISQ
ncbi:MAG: response regulator, partial [Elusimicrobiota bacterium]